MRHEASQAQEVLQTSPAVQLLQMLKHIEINQAGDMHRKREAPKLYDSRNERLSTFLLVKSALNLDESSHDQIERYRHCSDASVRVPEQQSRSG